MSISRLRRGSLTRPHEVSDDLESFFWVLLYLVVKCRNSKGMSLGQLMRSVFDQHTKRADNGIATGGEGKLYCLYKVDLGERTVRKLVKTPCRYIIEELRRLFHDFYHSDETVLDLSENSDSGSSSTDEDERERAIQIREASKKLSSSEWILEMINRYLSSEWDVDDDGSLNKTVLRPDSAAGRNRRKRKAVDTNEEKMTFNKRRKGRLPPPSTDSESSRDTFY